MGPGGLKPPSLPKNSMDIRGRKEGEAEKNERDEEKKRAGGRGGR